MNLCDIIESKVLFGLMRLAALASLMLLVLAVAVAIVLMPKIWPRSPTTHIDRTQLMSASDAWMHPPAGAQFTMDQIGSIEDTGPLNVTVPPMIRDWFVSASPNPKQGEDNLNSFLEGDVRSVPESARQDYLDNLAEVMTAAKQAGVPINVALMVYERQKRRALNELDVRNAEADKTRAYIVGFFTAALGLAGLFSLTLVMLAIERNTRRLSPPVQ